MNKIIGLARKIIRYKNQHKKLMKKYNEMHVKLTNNPQPLLTKEDKAEIDAYWKQYGIKFPDYSWFQWYYGLTGQKDPRFISGELYRMTILPYYNYRPFLPVYKDKNLADRHIPNAKFPDTIVKKINGEFYDEQGRYYEKIDEVCELLLGHKEIIVKDAWETGKGSNVKKYAITSIDDCRKVLTEWECDNYLIQKVIKQHPFFASFNESSVNIVRVHTFYYKGQVKIINPIIRFGKPGYSTDVWPEGKGHNSRVVGVTEEGIIKDEVIYLNGKKESLEDCVGKVERCVPCWNEILALVEDGAKQLEHLKIVGWDITVSEENQPIVIEYNTHWPGEGLAQIASGPFFGELTDEALGFLKERKNQKKYVFKKLRSK